MAKKSTNASAKNQQPPAQQNPKPSSATAQPVALSEDFPGVEVLRKAGITTFDQLDDVEDLMTIPGVTHPLAVQIGDALDALDLPEGDEGNAIAESQADAEPEPEDQPEPDIDDASADEPVAEPADGNLPADFPYRDLLYSNGVATVEDVRRVGDLTELGIPAAHVTIVRHAAGYK